MNEGFFWGEVRLFNLFDFTRGRDRQRCREYLRRLCRMGGNAHLDVYAWFALPQLTEEFRQFLRAEHPGAIGRMHREEQSTAETLCTCSDGKGLAVLGELIEEFMRDFPEIRGIMLVTLDCEAHLCDGKCPYAHGTSQADHAANLVECVQQAMRRVRRDAQLLVYPWFWKPGFKEAVIPRLKEPYFILSRFSQLARQQIEPGIAGEPLFDASLVLPESMGSEFADWLKRVGPEHVADVLPAGTGIDCLFLAAPPNPVGVYRRLRALATCGVRQFVDFDCGGHHPGSCEETGALFHENPGIDESALLGEVAARLYHRPEARGPAVRGWQAFGRGFVNLPIGLGETGSSQFSGRFGMAWPMCIATPLVREAISDTDQRHKIHYFSPYNFFRPDLAERLEACLLRVLTDWQAAAQELAVADALEGHTAASKQEALSAEGHVVCVLSALNWCGAARVAKKPDGKARFAQSQRLESDLVRRFQGMLRQWPGLWDNNCWHPHYTPLGQRLGLGLDRYHDAFEAKLAIQSARQEAE